LSQTTQYNGSFIWFFPWIPQVTGTVTTIAMRCNSAAGGGTLKVAIYDAEDRGISTYYDDRQVPITKLGEGSVSVASGLLTITGLSISVTKGSKCWIAINSGSSSNSWWACNATYNNILGTQTGNSANFALALYQSGTSFQSTTSQNFSTATTSTPYVLMKLSTTLYP
jgi:hypothetical protein